MLCFLGDPATPGDAAFCQSARDSKMNRKYESGETSLAAYFELNYYSCITPSLANKAHWTKSIAARSSGIISASVTLLRAVGGILFALDIDSGK
jgi:hypothetical protein